MREERKFSESSPDPKEPRTLDLGQAKAVRRLVSQDRKPLFVGRTIEGDVIVVIPHEASNRIFRRLGKGQEFSVEEEVSDGIRKPLVCHVMSKAAADSLRRMYILASHNRRIPSSSRHS